MAMGRGFPSNRFPLFLDFFGLFVGLTIRNPDQTVNGILTDILKTGDNMLLASVQFNTSTSVFNQPVMGVYSTWKSRTAIQAFKSSLTYIEMNNMPQMPLRVKYETSF